MSPKHAVGQQPTRLIATCRTFRRSSPEDAVEHYTSLSYTLGVRPLQLMEQAQVGETLLLTYDGEVCA